MRLRTYTAATATDAMALIREQLGPDSIIISTQSLEDGSVQVTAALETDDLTAASVGSDAGDYLHEALASHAVPPRLIEKLLHAAAEFSADDPAMVLAGALDVVFSFVPLGAEGSARRLRLVCP